MKPFDWVVIAVYMLGMLGIGYLYSKQNTSKEEYLLGNRRMGSTSVGLSLFASLLSTISYLAYPGEMIKNGPLAFGNILLYPLVFFIVGFALIPCFMRLQVTSAYEILEKRFGLSVRMAGSLAFLLLRLMWMGVIVFITVDKVLVPTMGLPSSATPYLCIVMGVITVIYTSMGGIKAVVTTDVIQSLVLLGGAFLTLIIVSWTLGGVGEWWPTTWNEKWQTLDFSLGTSARVTVFSAAISQCVWWICTAGSDQMAVQRYLSTRDQYTARKVLQVSLITSAVSVVLLAFVGLALLKYFSVHPDMMKLGAIKGDADKMFTGFIVYALPQGITGLVIAGLLSAAMSSLSSGLNSSCLVITVDFFERLGLSPGNEAHKVRLAKIVSWLVGGFIVVVSTLVGLMDGNLLEINFRTSNLLVAPLFVLFFMAIFVPWATTFGAWSSIIAATAVAVAIAFKEVLGLDHLINLSFMWIMPVSLICGIVAGCLASLLPISPRRPMLAGAQPDEIPG